MKIVCPSCRTVYEITIEAVSNPEREFAVYQCVVCNFEFQVLFTKILAPKSKEEIYLIPRIINTDKTKIISENLSKTVRDDIW